MKKTSSLLPLAALLIAVLACSTPELPPSITPTPTKASVQPSRTPAQTGSTQTPIALARTATSTALPQATPLDEETLQRLEISGGKTLQLQPGENRQLQVVTLDCCYMYNAWQILTAWSIQPDQGASIDPASGLLIVDAETPHGTTYTITASVENGRRRINRTLFIFTPEGNPLAGTWREAAQLPCSGSGEKLPAEAMRELIFGADSTMSATWMPFEIYKDYWGKYRYELQSGSFALSEISGSYVPADLDPSGSFEIDENGDLILKDMWLGSYQWGENNPTNCGHRFTHY